MANLEPLMKQNFLEYASYVIVDRAIPELRDGLKPVQRRLLTTLWNMHDGKFHKVANVIGETMKLHPHGDASIGDALVVLANKDYFIERQGNFGSIITGHPAAAARYIECRLTPLAVETLFNDDLTEVVPSYDGRRDEPVCLPAKLPVVLMLGTEGIAVGMATRILPHNLEELLRAQIALLEKKKVLVHPDFPQGGLMDVAEYEDGRGRVRVRAKIEADDDKTIVIREVPYGTTTEQLIASIETAAQKGKLKVGSIQDFTTDRAEIQITLPRGVSAEETIPQLFAYTLCEASLASSLTVIRDRHPAQMTVTEVLQDATAGLKRLLKAELDHELQELEAKRHWLTLERIFIEKRVYKDIEKAKTADAVRKAVWDGMHEHEKLFVRAMQDEDVTRLLEIRIRRISAYDIEKSKKDVGEIEQRIKKVRGKLRNMTKTSIAYLEHLIDTYGDRWPRRTKITTFDTVDKRTVARPNLKVAYDPESGFFGTAVRGGTTQLTMSAYDRVLIVSSDGTYRVLGPEEKVLIPGKALYLEPFDEEHGVIFTVVYRNKLRLAFAKKVHIHKYVRAREYRLIKDKGGKVDLLFPEETQRKGLFREPRPLGWIEVSFVPKPRQRINEAAFDLDTLELTGVGARGTRIAGKPVRRVKRLKS